MMSRRWIIPGLLVLLALAFCAGYLHISWDHARGGFHQLNLFHQSRVQLWEKEWPLYVEDACDPALRVILEVTQGVLEWELRDPLGQIQWHGSVTGPRLHRETRAFDSIPGQWQVTLRSEAAGTYEIRWKGFLARPSG